MLRRVKKRIEFTTSIIDKDNLGIKFFDGIGRKDNAYESAQIQEGNSIDAESTSLTSLYPSGTELS